MLVCSAWASARPAPVQGPLDPPPPHTSRGTPWGRVGRARAGRGLGAAGRGPWAHGPAFAEHIEGDPLADVGLGAAVLDQCFGSPAQHVDEAGCDGEAAGVDFASAPALQLGAGAGDTGARAADSA